jgi:hypothetical protein
MTRRLLDLLVQKKKEKEKTHGTQESTHTHKHTTMPAEVCRELINDYVQGLLVACTQTRLREQ